MGSYLFGVVLFALGITVAIGLHEAGHMVTAKLMGMRVRQYFIGFGPRIFSFRRGHTEYGLAALPFGGFCDIAGMTNQDELAPDEVEHAMRNKAPWQRIIVLLGGIAMNIVIGLCIIFGLAVTSGLPNPNVDRTATVGELTCVADQQPDGSLRECTGPGPAEQSGIAVGDRILAVGGVDTPTFPAVSQAIQEHGPGPITLNVERDGQTRDVRVDVAPVSRIDAAGTPRTVGAIGVASAPITDAIRTYNPAAAVGATFRFSGEVFTQTGKALVQLPSRIPGVVSAIFGGQRDVESPMSVVGAARVGGELAQHSQWPAFWMMLAGLNYFLAVFNVIPLPPFDGGHVAVVVAEIIRNWWRRLHGLEPAGPMDYRRLMPVTYAIAATLLVLGAVFIVADVVNPVRVF